ncbi:helix-turn-helix domain-containing protein [Turicibacter sanguinis]|uniref:helix-turn-helix domain-containing protein n=1 Tax=Turicibacter sanguinis TaxID=154288 RepID=UPI0018AA3367|nr:helix-turn-helix domain-containing protein [Turicibacter sanguinis]MDB8564560.1 helix-turn-helix domain-containing protein [Turicibacter sanguinis]
MAKVQVEIKDKKLLTVAEVSALLNISDPTIRKIIKAGDLPILRIGKNILIYAYEVDDFCKRMTHKQLDFETATWSDIDYSQIGA